MMMQKGGKMAISEKKMQIVIDNYFKSECDINTSIRSAFEKGFRIGVKKALSAQPEQKWIPCSDPPDLPKDKRLWITREISDGFFTLREVSDVIWDMTEWSGSVSNVVAYMPYWEPEPYKERREE